MSYAIIQTGGKQYKVKAGEILKIERLESSKKETKVEFKEILAYGDDKTIEVGSPMVEGAKVEANLIENGKNRTILIFKKRRRQNSRRKNGHRQQYSLIRISKIFSKDGKVLSEAEKIVKQSKKIEKVDAKAKTKVENKKIEAKVASK
ncbi:50S ribosomal protein L21 [Candidatus Pelagibacter bacterium]|nr:50S ribosomal protein L21 [Candidatus Pelagibacter bacterium]|tara:strand:- start:226 stop:669 length:444 start_codon:yes stop_codon:yes gene_type:complete